MLRLALAMDTARSALEDASTYVEQNRVFQLFETLLADLIIFKPDDPVDHLINALKQPPKPRIMVAGPPGAQARSVCEVLAAKSGIVHVIASDVWRELAKLNSASGLEAKSLVENGQPVPDDLMLAMLKEKLTSGECATSGWVLEGYPSTPPQARSMLAAGLLPTRFLHIKLSDAEVKRRLTGRRVDPVENKVYHLQDASPPDAATAERVVQRDEDTPARVDQRLSAYRHDMTATLSHFSKVLVEIDGSLGVDKMLEAALPLVSAEMPSRAPRGAARVALLGGPGSNAQALGAALATCYGAKLISAVELLHAAALSGSKHARQAMEATDPTRMAEQLLGPLVLERLAAEDVRTSGFVLVGYPFTAQHAAWLKKQGVWLRDVVHLKLDPKDAEAIVCGTRFDPIDGETYHMDTNPPSDTDTLARLVVHPQHKPAVVKHALQQWAKDLPGLLKAFPDTLRVEDASRPEHELVERLAPCFIAL